jgi:formylglycine-generating enzyme required for sulfatase activity
MSGNVWEWCHDRYGLYTNENQINPTGAPIDSVHLIRGGGMNSSAETCRSAFRYSLGKNEKRYNIGFRIVLPKSE